MTLRTQSEFGMVIAAKRHSDLEGRTAAVDAVVAARFPLLPGISLLAAGGYGRREMFPFSDVDLIILADKLSDLPRQAVSEFVQDLWDAGLRVSQTVHTVSECLALHAKNLELSISLLDRRFLAGDPEPYHRLAPALDRFFERGKQDLLDRLIRSTRERHDRFQNTIFHLEPNLKEGLGGLRDYAFLRWVARLRGEFGVLSELAAPAAEIIELRWLLHELSGRDNNVLDFESQDAIAFDENLSPDELMGCFYRGARQIQRAAVHVLDARHGSRATGSRPLNSQPLTWEQFHQILILPNAAVALRNMHESGYLIRLFPEFAVIECLVIRDFYHQYTVDEHTLVAIANVLALRGRQDSPFGELAREHSDLSLLLMALLFHDVGKGTETESHAESSARLASGALTRIGMPGADTETVLFLIRAHLDMSATMNSRDLSEPSTLRAMADRVGTVERLKLLTLLTYADISAVNPSAMSPWRSSLLWQLYSATHRELMRELQSERLHVNSVFLEGLPVRYLRTHSDADIQRHLRMAQAGTAVDLQKKDGFYELTAVTRDRPALFASIAGAISSFGMNILKAEAFSNAAGTVIDTMTFEDPIRTLELNPSESAALEETVRRAALGEEDVAQLLKRRPLPRFGTYEPRIAFDNDASPTSTLLQIVAVDRPGLLYAVASAISAGGCNIEVVLVDTQGRKAVDVFYIAPKLNPESFPRWTDRLSALL